MGLLTSVVLLLSNNIVRTFGKVFMVGSFGSQAGPLLMAIAVCKFVDLVATFKVTV
jgi:hypothetical protein